MGRNGGPANFEIRKFAQGHSVKFVFVRNERGKDGGALPKTSSKHSNFIKTL